MLFDLHIHSDLSFDSDEKAENYVAEAERLGLAVTGFSEHYDYDAYLDGAGIALADLDAYSEKIAGLRALYPEMKILQGIEFGYRKEALGKYSELNKSYPFDYVINSVHTLPKRGDCYFDGFFAEKTLKESYQDYFNAVLESVKADLDYQIVGHIGYVSRYREGIGAKIVYKDFSEIIDSILTEIIARDKCLEINASTGKAGGLSLPDGEIIKRYLSLGGEKLSFGSDAHALRDYRKKSSEASDFLRSVGVKYLFHYEQKRAVAYKI